MNIDELLPFYALDALTDEERAFVEAELAKNPALQAELDELQSVAELLPHASEPVMPSRLAKSKLFERVDESIAQSRVAEPAPVIHKIPPKPPQTVSWLEALRRQFATPAVAGAFAFAALLFIWAFSLQGQLRESDLLLADANTQNALLQTELATAQNELASSQAALAQRDDILTELEAEVESLVAEVQTVTAANGDLQHQLDERGTILAFYRDPDLLHIEVAGTAVRPEAGGLFTVDEEVQQAALWVTGLEVLESQRQYQIWYLQDGKAIMGEAFQVEPDGRASVFITSAELEPYDGIIISIEPATGSGQPSDDIVLSGEL